MTPEDDDLAAARGTIWWGCAGVAVWAVLLWAMFG